MSGTSGAIGLIVGGLLTEYLSWRWILFVNVPIGIGIAIVGSLAFEESARYRVHLDLAGALTGTAAATLLVYFLSKVSTSHRGTPFWTDTKAVISLAAAVTLLITFVLIEWRSRQPILPIRILANRNHSAAHFMMLCSSAVLSGSYFFLTIYAQEVLRYSAIKFSIAFLPFAIMIGVAATTVARVVIKTGVRPLIIAGVAATSSGTYWFSRLNEHSSYVSGLLGPMLITSVGLCMLFVPLQRIALINVRSQDSTAGSGLIVTSEHMGEAIGLAALGTVAWTVVADDVTKHTDHALSVGFSRMFEVCAAIILAAGIIVVARIRVSRGDLTHVSPAITPTLPVGHDKL